jgi:hypothetical protein
MLVCLSPGFVIPKEIELTAFFRLSGACVCHRALRYTVPKLDTEETKREVGCEVAEAGKQLFSVLLFHSRLKLADRHRSACRRPPSDSSRRSAAFR